MSTVSVNATMPITVMSQNTDTVSFTVNQVFKAGGTISWMATRFNDVNQGNARICPKLNEVSPGSVDYSKVSSVYPNNKQLTAKCVDGIANVELYIHDGSKIFKQQAVFTVPADCNPSADIGNKMGYIFSVPCIPGCKKQGFAFGKQKLDCSTVDAENTIGCPEYEAAAMATDAPTEVPV
jgi:hypothetical protein